MYYRLIKPAWAKQKLKTGEANPEFVKAVAGPDTFEGSYEPDFLKKRNAEGYHIYFFPNHPKRVPNNKPYLSGRDIDVFEWVFVDMDLKDEVYESKDAFLAHLKTFPAQPTMVVDSGNGIHAYWQIADLDRDSYIYTQLSLIQHFKTDSSIWTPLQLMRCPGYHNTKVHNNLKLARIVSESSSGIKYQLEDLTKYLPPLTPDNLRRMQEHTDKLDGKKEVEIPELNRDYDQVPSKFKKLIKHNRRARMLFEEPKSFSGDRSQADMALANVLYSEGFEREEALKVILNTSKSRSRTGDSRYTYAFNTLDKVYRTRSTKAAKSVVEYEASGTMEASGTRVQGPSYLDCLEKGWRKKQVLGIVAGPGVGKTSISLNIVEQFIVNNRDNDDIFIFFTLEMPPGDIIERWNNLIGGNKKLSERLYIVSNREDNGDILDIGLQEIVEYSKDTVRKTGKKLGAVIIDHISIIHKVVDVGKKPNFGAEAEITGGLGRKRTLNDKAICKGLKTMARILDTFLIVQSQTTKVRAGEGDTPLGLNAAYGAADFEWNCDYVLTCWQPIRRVYDQTDIRALAWQYVKIREKRAGDRVCEFSYQLLNYDLDQGRLDYMTEEVRAETQQLIIAAAELRKAAEKHQEQQYHNSPRPAPKLTLKRGDLDEDQD